MPKTCNLSVTGQTTTSSTKDELVDSFEVRGDYKNFNI